MVCCPHIRLRLLPPRRPPLPTGRAYTRVTYFLHACVTRELSRDAAPGDEALGAQPLLFTVYGLLFELTRCVAARVAVYNIELNKG